MSLFRLGSIEITPAASATLATVHADPATYLARHEQGDWGEVDEVTQQDNALAVEYHQPICSMYRLSDGTELLVITTGDRSSTRMYLAAEYPVRKVSTQEGYARWAATYFNPLRRGAEALHLFCGQPLFTLIDSEYTYEQLNYQMGLASM